MRTWLAQTRKNKKFTHQQVADLAGIKRQYYGSASGEWLLFSITRGSQ